MQTLTVEGNPLKTAGRPAKQAREPDPGSALRPDVTADPPASGDDPRVLKLLAELCESNAGLPALAGALDLTLADLARWAMSPGNRGLLEGLLHVADIRAALAVCRYRTIAAAVLINIATERDADARPDDLARKACVDLLKAHVRPGAASEFTGEPGNNASDADAGAENGPGAPSAEAILAALERLGETS